ncbi:MAG: sugar phosphate isomerase/epimerase family protein [Pirellulaceae bacterium]|jgi:hexulose-6-phosphate isomerase|nr:sugar phosphate isomerase/epimerase family protein [Pirellulaceae bacterium]MDP7014850.1 sugar phosphate isomerase/epimerase family protein [Pirellulaceae bacterium]
MARQVTSVRWTRRRFLAAAGAGSVAGLAAPALAAAPPWRKAVKLGMVHIEGDLAAQFRAVKDAGFDGIEMRSPGGPRPDRLQQAVKETGLTVHGVGNSRHWKLPLSDPNPDVREQGFRALLVALRHSREYSGDSVLLNPGVVRPGTTFDQCWVRSTGVIRRALADAEKHRVKILIENAWNAFLTKPEDLARYVDQFKSPWIGVSLDLACTMRYSSPPEWIAALGDRIAKIDVRDIDATVGKEEGWRQALAVRLGEGDCPWAEIRAAMASRKFNGWWTADVAGGGAKELVEVAKRMDRVLQVG